MSEDDSDSGELMIDEKSPLSACPAKFHGIIDKGATEEFISKIEHFKLTNRISNESALRDLNFLFHGPSLAWWKSVKDAVKTWDDAITLIRYIYAPTRPPHLIYSDIFQQKQETAKIEEFIERKRTLFRQLPKPHPESVQIDMIYWMLNPSIRQNIPRDSVETFDEIILRAKEVEYPSRKVNVRKRKKRCGFCRIRGHTTEDCRQKPKRFAEATAVMSEPCD